MIIKPITDNIKNNLILFFPCHVIDVTEINNIIYINIRDVFTVNIVFIQEKKLLSINNLDICIKSSSIIERDMMTSLNNLRKYVIHSIFYSIIQSKDNMTAEYITFNNKADENTYLKEMFPLYKKRKDNGYIGIKIISSMYSEYFSFINEKCMVVPTQYLALNNPIGIFKIENPNFFMDILEYALMFDNPYIHNIYIINEIATVIPDKELSYRIKLYLMKHFVLDTSYINDFIHNNLIPNDLLEFESIKHFDYQIYDLFVKDYASWEYISKMKNLPTEFIRENFNNLKPYIKNIWIHVPLDIIEKNKLFLIRKRLFIKILCYNEYVNREFVIKYAFLFPTCLKHRINILRLCDAKLFIKYRWFINFDNILDYMQPSCKIPYEMLCTLIGRDLQ